MCSVWGIPLHWRGPCLLDKGIDCTTFWVKFCFLASFYVRLLGGELLLQDWALSVDTGINTSLPGKQKAAEPIPGAAGLLQDSGGTLCSCPCCSAPAQPWLLQGSRCSGVNTGQGKHSQLWDQSCLPWPADRPCHRVCVGKADYPNCSFIPSDAVLALCFLPSLCTWPSFSTRWGILMCPCPHRDLGCAASVSSGH